MIRQNKKLQKTVNKQFHETRKKVGDHSEIFLRNSHPKIFYLGAKKEQLKQCIQDSLNQSKGFSLGKIRDICLIILWAPIKVPWTWIKLLFKPYVRTDTHGPLGMNGLRWLEFRYIVRRWSLFILLLTAVFLAAFIPLRMLVNQCEACDNPPFEKPLGGVCKAKNGSATVPAQSEAECTYIDTPSWQNGVWVRPMSSTGYWLLATCYLLLAAGRLLPTTCLVHLAYCSGCVPWPRLSPCSLLLAPCSLLLAGLKLHSLLRGLTPL